MKDFSSFGAGLNFGRYRSIRGPLKNLHPGTKLGSIITGLLILTLTGSISGQLILLLLIFSAAAWTGIPPGSMLYPLKPIWFFLLLVLLIHGLTLPREAGEALLSRRDILPMMVMAGRILTLVSLLGLFSALLTTAEISYGVEALLSPLARIGLPASELALIATITFRFIPFLRQESERLAKAQTARGGSLGFRSANPLRRIGASIPIMVPLFIGTLRKAEILAESMHLRGYREKVARSRLHRYTAGRIDLIWLMLLLTAAILVVLLTLTDGDAVLIRAINHLISFIWRITV